LIPGLPFVFFTELWQRALDYPSRRVKRARQPAFPANLQRSTCTTSRFMFQEATSSRSEQVFRPHFLLRACSAGAASSINSKLRLTPHRTRRASNSSAYIGPNESRAMMRRPHFGLRRLAAAFPNRSRDSILCEAQPLPPSQPCGLLWPHTCAPPHSFRISFLYPSCPQPLPADSSPNHSNIYHYITLLT
jgi:hypothetical protein